MILAMLILAVLAVTLLSCASDVRQLRIPNAHVAIVAGCFAAGYAWSPDSFGPWWSHLGAAAVFFVLTYLMFCAGILGAGDAKLGTALSLWTGLPGLMIYVIYMALAGGVLGMASLVLKNKKPFANPQPGGWVATVQSGGNAVPYGIAITVGAWAALFHTGFLHQQIDEVIKIAL